MTETLEKIGNVFVDSGMLMVGDPCYSLHRDEPYDEFGKGWDGFVDLTMLDKDTSIGGGLAIVFGTLHGDGTYGVYRNSDGNIVIDINGTYED